MNATQLPNLNELLKAAAAGTLDRARITSEALRQTQAHDGEETKTASTQVPGVEHVSTEEAEKLAGALLFVADNLGNIEKSADEGSGQKPGEGPGALQVMEATSSESNIDAGQSGQATGKNQPPQNPQTQAEQVQTGGANTGLETNDDTTHPEQPTSPISNESAPIGAQKEASVFNAGQVARLLKLGQLEHFGGKKAPPYAGKAAKGASPAAMGKKASAPVALIRKLAEDAINPAQIDGGGTHNPADPPDGVSAAEEAKPPVPSDVSSQQNMVASNDAAIDYTKRDAKADPKSDVNQVLSEPAQSASTDKTLAVALDHTEEAGAKIAASLVKTSAARVLLGRFLKSAEENCAPGAAPAKSKDDEKKKEKSSMGGMAPNSPTAASGFTATSL